MESPDPRASLRRGIRLGLPYAAASFLLAVSFGVLAREAGMPAAPAIAMSLIVLGVIVAAGITALLRAV